MGGSSNSLLLLALMLLLSTAATSSGESTTETPSALLPLEARSADVSGEEDVISTSYVLPNQIFNEGKPVWELWLVVVVAHCGGYVKRAKCQPPLA